MADKFLDKALISLSFIKVNWDRQRQDYIDNFLPFLATLIVKNNYSFIGAKPEEIDKLLKDFTREFGLIIPYHPMVVILKRAKKRGIIRKQFQQFIPTDKVYEYDFSDKMKTQERKHEELIKSFMSFCKDKYDKVLNKKKAEKTLISFLEQRGMEVLSATYDDSVLPKVESSKSELFLFNKFVESINSSNETLFQILLDIVIGHILANIILYGHEASKIYKPKLKDLNLYLDTELIFRLLGLEGNIVQSFYSEFLSQLNKQEVNLYIFQHTYNEIMDILQDALLWIDNQAYDPTKASLVLRYFKSIGYKQSDVQIFINKVDDILSNFAISLARIPNSNEYSQYQINEEKLKNFAS